MCGINQAKIKKRTLALRELLEENKDESVKKFLSSFSCEQDIDIQKFLQNRAVDFEKLSKSRTYFIISEEQSQNPQIPFEDLIIYGYISLAMKVYAAPDTISNRQRQQLDGFSAKEHGKTITNFPCYLIGQLARNSNVPKDSISGAELLNFALDIIAISVDAVGGRNILIECRNDTKLKNFYIENDFHEISALPDENQSMVQMIRRI